MGKASIYQLVSELIAPTVTEHNAELVDVEYIKAGKVWTLRVFIDKKQNDELKNSNGPFSKSFNYIFNKK